MKGKENRILFCCYDPELRRYLYSKGIKYELCALNPNSKSMFWIFIRNTILDKALEEWASHE